MTENGKTTSMEVDMNDAAETISTAGMDNPKIVDTNAGAVDGQEKCPKCGATDISLNVTTGKLRCNFCRHEFEPEKAGGLQEDISSLDGHIMGSGAQDIVADTKDVVTLKCGSCGAEVVIDTAEALQARCHWCRNTLSLNQQIPNGSIPDVILPFTMKKDEAKGLIEDFVGRRKFFAHPKFRREFTTENINGVYFPYMLVDVNGHADFSGEGEHEKCSYTVGSGDDKETLYDVDVYSVKRSFDITIKNLSIESSSDKLDKDSKEKTTNIINSIMPFDTENCVKWEANYLKGYTSERRDTNVSQLSSLVNAQSRDIAKYKANDTLEHYDRGVRWDYQNLDVKGQQWQAAYLPVWLYSYQQVSGAKKKLHYVAVNARTKETMGSVPIHMPKLLAITAILELLGLIAMLFLDYEYDWIGLLAGVIFFGLMYARYRNSDARHTYEEETESTMANLQEFDEFLRTETGVEEASMSGANNTVLEGSGSYAPMDPTDSVTGYSVADDLINSYAGNTKTGNLIKDKIREKAKKL